MEIIVSVACGLALFWTCFFSMLVRNSFPGDGAGGADAPWLSLALRIAFFIGFGAMAFLSSRSEKGVPDKREITIAGVLVVLFALDTVVMSQTTLSAGLALGFALELLPSATGALDHAMLSIISLGLVVLLAVFVTFTQGRMTADQAATDAEKIAQRIAAERMLEEKLRAEEHPSKGRWKSSCESVAEAAGLSARETEVFMLLAKGRGIEHIRNKLCISGHTVKTHTCNIYRKMGIGSREELLDAIEAVGGSGSADDR